MTRRVLLVDDEAAVRLAWKKVLQDEELDVDTAGSKAASFALLAANRYDAAVLDICLGGVDGEEGFEVLSRIRNLHPETVTIVVTAHGSRTMRERAYMLGADDFFVKPVSMCLIREALAVYGIASPPDRAGTRGRRDARCPARTRMRKGGKPM